MKINSAGLSANGRKQKHGAYSDGYIQKRIRNEVYALRYEEQREEAMKALLGIIKNHERMLVYFARPLIGAMRDGGLCRDPLDRIYNIIRGRKMGRATPLEIKKLIRTGTVAFTKEDQRERAKEILLKVIRDGENDLIYMVQPLVATLKDVDRECAKAASCLLDEIKERKLGRCDSSEIRRLTKTCIAAMFNEEQREQGGMILSKVIEEDENNLVYVGSPLVCVVQNENREFSEAVCDILKLFDGKKPGKAEPIQLKAIARRTTACMRNEREIEAVKKFVGGIIENGKNNLGYLVGPFIAALQEERSRAYAEEFLDAMKNKKMGICDSDTISMISRIFKAAAHNPSGVSARYAGLFAEKLVEEGNVLEIPAGLGNPANKSTAQYEGPEWKPKKQKMPIIHKKRKKGRTVWFGMKNR